MKLPLRLHKIIQEKLNTTKVLHKPASISKHLENLQISDMNMDKEAVQNEINYEKPIEDIKSSLGVNEVNLQDSIVKESPPKEINLTQYFQDTLEFEMKDDNFGFDTQEVKNYLLQNSGCIDTEENKAEESKDQIEEESNEVVNF